MAASLKSTQSMAWCSGARHTIGAKVKSWDIRSTPLILALQNGHREEVRALLARGANPTAKAENGDTALMMAAFQGHREVVQDLLSRGAEVNARAANGTTALAMAGDATIRALLLRAGAKS